MFIPFKNLIKEAFVPVSGLAPSVRESVKILLDVKKNPLLQCCKNDMKSSQAFLYEQANIMYVSKQFNNNIK